jgi:hypothetical protein
MDDELEVDNNRDQFQRGIDLIHQNKTSKIGFIGTRSETQDEEHEKV